MIWDSKHVTPTEGHMCFRAGEVFFWDGRPFMWVRGCEAKQNAVDLQSGYLAFFCRETIVRPATSAKFTAE